MGAQNVDFDIWMKDLRIVAIEQFGFDEAAINCISSERFRQYYDEGLTPHEAWKKEVID